MNRLKIWLQAFIAWLRSRDPNERTYWLGLLMLFVGLTWLVSMSVALTVVGMGMAAESVITSYLAALLGSRNQ